MNKCAVYGSDVDGAGRGRHTVAKNRALLAIGGWMTLYEERDLFYIINLRLCLFRLDYSVCTDPRTVGRGV